LKNTYIYQPDVVSGLALEGASKLDVPSISDFEDLVPEGVKEIFLVTSHEIEARWEKAIPQHFWPTI
jgi:hypothetical protein